MAKPQILKGERSILVDGLDGGAGHRPGFRHRLLSPRFRRAREGEDRILWLAKPQILKGGRSILVDGLDGGVWGSRREAPVRDLGAPRLGGWVRARLPAGAAPRRRPAG